MLIFLVVAALADLPVVVIDPGHVGAQAGATGICGLTEKDATLAVSIELGRLLDQSGRARTVLTRSDDRDIDLAARAQISNAEGASLFVSIHANASDREASKGIETYFLSQRAADRRLRALAQRENEGAPFFSNRADSDVQVILDGLRIDAAREASVRLATRLHKSLSAKLIARARGVQQAPFAVLVGAKAPAVLVEVGFLTNPDECAALAQVEHQRKVAQALAAAILAHLSVEERALALR